MGQPDHTQLDLMEKRLSVYREALELFLVEFFAKKSAAATTISRSASLLPEAVRALTMRGGKRQRALWVFAAATAVSEQDHSVRCVTMGAALECLQTYLLIHDDWMDGDLERRGGPSVHAQLRRTLGSDHLGDSVGILAGDLGSAYAWDLLYRAARGTPNEASLIEAFAQMHEEVVLGQEMDLTGHPDVEHMQRLKTGSYTVKGPVLFGALLGDADVRLQQGLNQFAEFVGEAFQVVDDVLGTFGDPKVTGKPRGGDLRQGKVNRVTRAFEEDHQLSTLWSAVRAETNPSDQSNLIDQLTKLANEKRLPQAITAEAEKLCESAIQSLEGLEGLTNDGRLLLERCAHGMVNRFR